MRELKHFGTGQTIGEVEAGRFPVIAAGTLPSGEEIAYAFESDDEFSNWAAATPIKKAFDHADHRMAQLRQRFEHTDQSKLANRVREATENVQRQLAELARRKGLDSNSRQLFEEAAHEIRVRDDPFSSSDPPSPDPTILNEKIAFGGPSVTIWDQAIPDLAWIGWSKRAYSARCLFGTGTLFTDRYWTGQKFRMFAFVYLPVEDLSRYGFGGNTQSFAPAYVP